MDVDEVSYSDVVGGGGDPGSDASDAEDSIIVNVWDIMHITRYLVLDLFSSNIKLFPFLSRSRAKGKRKAKRTWKQRIERFNNAWALRIDGLVDDFIKWKYDSSSPEDVVDTTHNFTIDVIDIHTLQNEAIIPRANIINISAASALVRAGYLPSSPETPSLAVSLRTLDLFRTLCLFKPNLSIEAFAKTVCHLYAVRIPLNSLQRTFIHWSYP